jgi:hypothetical protein
MKMEHRQNDTNGGEWQYFEKKLSQFHDERLATNSLNHGLALLPV